VITPDHLKRTQRDMRSPKEEMNHELEAERLLGIPAELATEE
jgi:hypothetical protein